MKRPLIRPLLHPPLVAPWLVVIACTAVPGSPGTTPGSSSAGSSGAASASSSGGVGSSSSGGGAWEARAGLPSARQETAVVTLGGRVIVIGGFDDQARVMDDVVAYAPGTDAWEELAPLPRPLHHCNAAAVNGTLYVAGALEGLGFTAVGDVLAYNASTDTWSTVGQMPAGSERGASAVGVHGTSMILAGGFRGGAVTDASALDVTTLSWTSLPPLPQPRDHLVGGVVGDRFTAVGGRAGALNGRVDILDLPGGTAWTRGADMPTARAGTMGAVTGERIYVFGGEGNAARGDGIFAEVESYDVAMNTWSTHRAMMPGRHGTGAATLNGVIHVPGGATVEAFGAVATHHVFVP